jgi:hypothetical protein
VWAEARGGAARRQYEQGNNNNNNNNKGVRAKNFDLVDRSNPS